MLEGLNWSGLSVNSPVTISGLSPDQYSISEDDPSPYTHLGFAVGTVDSCPAQPDPQFI